MKITQEELHQIISEEIEAAVEEGLFTQAKAGLKSLKTGLGGSLQRKKAALAAKMKAGAQRAAGGVAGMAGKLGSATAAQAAGELQAAAGETETAGEAEQATMKKGTVTRQKAQKIATILGADIKELEKDLGAFGLTAEPNIKGALRYLNIALDKAVTAAAAEE